jgi:hypothetical protein
MVNPEKAEKQILDVLVKAFDKLIKSTDNLSGAQLNGLGITTKALMHQRDVDVETRRNMVNVTKAVKLGQAQVEVKRKSIKVNEKLVKLRHVLNVRLEEEHGSQVRRNKMLQHSFDDVGSSMNFLTNSVKGNFGFQAALGGMTKKIMKGTKQFDALEANTVLRDKAQAGLDEASGAVTDHGKKGAAKGSLREKKEELKARQKSLDNINEERDNIKGIGTGEKSKGLFGTLSKMGKFFEKKALPIGLGIGVAGVLMSVIVKSFSASPLFAQMMKMMKFMVTLILMPIGTFFGAMLRPILITLLRKFIVPFYSTWMPVMMKWGGKAGTFLTDPWGYMMGKYNKTPIVTDETYTDIDDPSQNQASGFMPSSGMEGSGSIIESLFTWLNGGKTPESGALDKKADEIWGAAYADDTLPTDGDVTSPDIEYSDATKTEHDTGFRDLTPEEIAATEAAAAAAVEAVETISPARQKILDAQNQANIDNAQRTADNEALFKNAQDAKAEAEANKKPTQAEIVDEQRKLMGEFGQGGHTGGSRDVMAANIAKYEADKLAGEKTEIAGLGIHKGKTAADFYPAADGFNGMVNKPTMFLAGEAGSEHVSITPSGGSGGGGITINIQNMNGSDNDLRKLKQTILEVIQQSSANRGRL